MVELNDIFHHMFYEMENPVITPPTTSKYPPTDEGSELLNVCSEGFGIPIGDNQATDYDDGFGM